MLRFATFLAPGMEEVYLRIAEAVGTRLGTTADLHVGSDYSELADGRADVAFLCGLPYVHLADMPDPPVVPIAAPVLWGERYGGRPIYFSDVVVRADSGLTRFHELRGASWAFNEPDSHSGYGVVRWHLSRLGEVDAFFGRVVEAGFHDAAMRLVAGGAVDAAAIDSHVLAMARRDEPELARDLRVIESIGPSPIQPVVASARLPDRLIDSVRAALVALARDPAASPWLGRGLLARFVPVTDADYDDIRRMEAESDAAGLVGIGTPVEPGGVDSIPGPDRPTLQA